MLVAINWRGPRGRRNANELFQGLDESVPGNGNDHGVPSPVSMGICQDEEIGIARVQDEGIPARGIVPYDNPVRLPISVFAGAQGGSIGTH
jgi:hypothetical protein